MSNIEMQKYGDSNPSVVRESFQTGPAPAPLASAATTSTVVGTTIGDLLTAKYYQTQYDELKKKEVKEYTDYMMPSPFPINLLYSGDENGQVKVSTFVFLTHIVLASVAVYFSIRASCGFNPKQFAAALVCPYLYLPYYMSLYGFSKVCGSNINLKKNAARLEEAD